MSVIPEKNGCNVWLKQYGCYVHGDSYHFPDGTLIIRTHPAKIFPLPDKSKLHYEVDRILHWFDEHQMFGTLIVGHNHWNYFGYNGVEM